MDEVPRPAAGPGGENEVSVVLPALVYCRELGCDRSYPCDSATEVELFLTIHRHRHRVAALACEMWSLSRSCRSNEILRRSGAQPWPEDQLRPGDYRP